MTAMPQGLCFDGLETETATPAHVIEQAHSQLITCALCGLRAAENVFYCLTTVRIARPLCSEEWW